MVSRVGGWKYDVVQGGILQARWLACPRAGVEGGVGGGGGKGWLAGIT